MTRNVYRTQKELEATFFPPVSRVLWVVSVFGLAAIVLSVI